MRVILVGPLPERARVRAELVRALFEIVAEFPTFAASRAASVDADATIVTASSRPDDPIDEPLTAREVQVLELLAEGFSNKAIAVRLGISDQTVKFHVASISGKLGARNRTDAVRRAVRRGLITL
jgi:DNA-binding NarL/FixJ family response regulator